MNENRWNSVGVSCVLHAPTNDYAKRSEQVQFVEQKTDDDKRSS
jgi:hypothetical protein